MDMIAHQVLSSDGLIARYLIGHSMIRTVAQFGVQIVSTIWTEKS